MKLWQQEWKTSGDKGTWVVSPTCISSVIVMQKKGGTIKLSFSHFSPHVPHSSTIGPYLTSTSPSLSIKSISCPSLTTHSNGIYSFPFHTPIQLFSLNIIINNKINLSDFMLRICHSNINCTLFHTWCLWVCLAKCSVWNVIQFHLDMSKIVSP